MAVAAVLSSFYVVLGNILGSFYFGYIVTQVPGGWLATRFGGKWVCAGGLTRVKESRAPTKVNDFKWQDEIIQNLKS